MKICLTFLFLCDLIFPVLKSVDKRQGVLMISFKRDAGWCKAERSLKRYHFWSWRFEQKVLSKACPGLPVIEEVGDCLLHKFTSGL